MASGAMSKARRWEGMIKRRIVFGASGLSNKGLVVKEGSFGEKGNSSIPPQSQGVLQARLSQLWCKRVLCNPVIKP